MEPRETHRRRSCSAPPRRNAAGQDRGAARRDQAHAAIGPVILPSTNCRLYYRLVSNLLTPYEDVPSLRLLLGAIATQPVLDVVLAAGFTWAAHSSVAVVLLVMSFAAKGTIPPEAAFALVLVPISELPLILFLKVRPVMTRLPDDCRSVIC